MSRIGKQPIALPKGVEVTRNNGALQVKGPKGTLKREIVAGMEIKVEDGRLEVHRPSRCLAHRLCLGHFRHQRLRCSWSDTGYDSRSFGTPIKFVGDMRGIDADWRHRIELQQSHACMDP